MIQQVRDTQKIGLRFGDARLTTGVRVRYVRQGDPAGPAVILLHGYSDSSFSWSAVLPLMPAAWHVLALDQRGHGDSDRPRDGYRLEDFAADVLAFMDTMGLPSATIVGHSMGSWVAQRVAAMAPHRVERLVLVASSATTRLAIVAELGAAIQELNDPVPVNFVREFQASSIHCEVPQAFFERAVAESLKLPARVWQAVVAGWPDEAYVAKHSRMSMPVLLHMGERDAMFSRAEQEQLAFVLPHAEVIVYPDTGHAIHWEHPEQFVRDLERFVAGC
jgi:non-heme chloroperoxidase